MAVACCREVVSSSPPSSPVTVEYDPITPVKVGSAVMYTTDITTPFTVVRAGAGARFAMFG